LIVTKKRRLRVKPKFRTVFDTNVYVARALSKNPRSPNAELFELLKADAYLLIWCEEIRAEVAEKLLTRNLSAERIAEFIAEVISLAVWIEVPASAIQRYVEDDPDDDIIVACAVAANATHIVSNDQHLLSLKKPFPGCVILNSLHFLFLVRGDKPPLQVRLHNWVRRLIKML